MRILATQYTLSKRSLDIYTAGCKGPHCKGCHNPETWDFDLGHEWGEACLSKVREKISDFPKLIERLMVFGGEPLDNPTVEVVEMLEGLKRTDRQVWLFTRYDFEEVPQEIKNLCDYIKCGRFEESMKVAGYVQYGIELATSNQRIYKVGA